MLKTASKVFSAVAIFILPLFVVYKRYQTTTVTVEVNNGIGLIPTIFIGTAILTGLYWLVSQLRAKLKQNPFSWLSLIIMGSVLGLSLFGVWFGINSVTISAQTQLDEFVNTMIYHRQTLFYMMIPIVSGIGLGVVSWALGLKFKP